MSALKPYMKSSLPTHADLLRKFGPAEEEQDQLLRRLVVTLDLTLTDLSKPPEYRANQAAVFLSFNHDNIAQMFSYARVITCDSLPRVEKSTGAFTNTMGLWVREEDVETAAALIGQQRWVAKVEQGRTHIVPAAEQEPLSSRSDATYRLSQDGVQLSL